MAYVSLFSITFFLSWMSLVFLKNLFIFGLFVETAPFVRVINFVSIFYFPMPPEQSTEEAT